MSHSPNLMVRGGTQTCIKGKSKWDKTLAQDEFQPRKPSRRFIGGALPSAPLLSRNLHIPDGDAARKSFFARVGVGSVGFRDASARRLSQARRTECHNWTNCASCWLENDERTQRSAGLLCCAGPGLGLRAGADGCLSLSMPHQLPHRLQSDIKAMSLPNRCGRIA